MPVIAAEPMTMTVTVDPLVRRVLAAAALVAGLWPLAATATAGVVVGVVIEGEVQPGVYGRVEIGNRPPPPVLYPQPLIIVAPRAVAAPVYLHVPPGHAKNWGKHCHKYNACAVPVYFVRSGEHDDHRGRGRGRERD
jgi:hypothetical protein